MTTLETVSPDASATKLSGLARRVTPLTDRLVVGIVVVLAIVGLNFGRGVTSTLIIGVALLAGFSRNIFAARDCKILAAGTVALLANGLLIHMLSAADVAPRWQTALYPMVFLLTQGILAVIVYVALNSAGFVTVMIAASIGFIVRYHLLYGYGILNIKYVAGASLVLLVAIISRPRAQVFLIVVIAVVGMLNGARSFAAIALAAALLPFVINLAQVWRIRGRATRYTATGLVLLCVGIIAYEIGTKLLLSGVLGHANQVKTERQILITGDLLTSARPEWAASLALFRADPFGAGPAAIPTSETVSVAKTGLAGIGFRGGDYVSVYLFGGRIELHSVVADLWTNFGIAGLALGLTIGAYLLLNLVRILSHPVQQDRIVLYCIISSLWYLPFGPWGTNLPFVAFTVALVMWHRQNISIHEPRIAV